MILQKSSENLVACHFVCSSLILFVLFCFGFLDGMAAFQAFLKSEFSYENIEFWLICEEYKKIRTSSRLTSKAKKIFERFIEANAPKEVLLFKTKRANLYKQYPMCIFTVNL